MRHRAGGIGHCQDALLTAIIGYVDDERSVAGSTGRTPSNGAVAVGSGCNGQHCRCRAGSVDLRADTKAVSACRSRSRRWQTRTLWAVDWQWCAGVYGCNLEALLQRPREGVMAEPWSRDPDAPSSVAPLDYVQRGRVEAAAVTPRLSPEGAAFSSSPRTKPGPATADHLGTEHLVLGTIAHESCAVSVLLRSMGIAREDFRAHPGPAICTGVLCPQPLDAARAGVVASAASRP